MNKQSKLLACIFIPILFLVSVYLYNFNPFPKGENGWTGEDFLNSDRYKDYIRNRTFIDVLMLSSLAGFVIFYFMHMLQIFGIGFSDVKKPILVLTSILILVSVAPILQFLTLEVYDFFFFLDFSSNANQTLGRFYTNSDFSRSIKPLGWPIIVILSFFFASNLTFIYRYIKKS